MVIHVHSIGVIAKDMHDYAAWVDRQGYDENRKYFPILNADQTKRKFDEIVYTVLASANPEYSDIYRALNGVYNKPKKFYTNAI